MAFFDGESSHDFSSYVTAQRVERVCKIQWPVPGRLAARLRNVLIVQLNVTDRERLVVCAQQRETQIWFADWGWPTRGELRLMRPAKDLRSFSELFGAKWSYKSG